MQSNKPVVLLILDGWGVNASASYNAIEQALTPQWDEWWATMPHGVLQASGEAVGLPKGQMGNSEVGHMHLGAGRVILQDLTRINQAIAQHGWEGQPVLLNLLNATTAGHKLHVMGLLSPGGVHSHEDHLFALLDCCQKLSVTGLELHLFLDGRDTPPQSALASIERLQQRIDQSGVARIASICGRYYAMDRDHRWDRTEQAYRLITEGHGVKQFADIKTALQSYYHEGCFDEFIPPTVIGEPVAMQAGDSVFCFNFRSDRVRQLMEALVLPNFSGFQRQRLVAFHQVVTLTQYDVRLPVEVVFAPQRLQNTLGEVLAQHGLKQLRIAETEKYAHVTFFFNGGEETPYPGESRVLIPSPGVKTYDLSPEMSARALTDQLVEVILAKTTDVIICNYANADMVGHTGVMAAACAAIACLDDCMARVNEAVQAVGGCLMITADHGNAETMFDEETGQAHTAHTAYPVPFVFVGKGWHYQAKQGSLIDVAPTILQVLGIEQPKDMSGHALLARI
ncbi:MAG: 2,3-bisphosphoglycerate-independent phosphoglycerate mutase [Gammaproteobacteria bacterium]|nr:2,3-bisphosphoglycerate-independent phosphoglycerate mutase [Gammaproteobacteria bacterium]